MPTAGDRSAVSAIALKYRQATLDLPPASIRTMHSRTPPNVPLVRSLGSRDLRGLRPPPNVWPPYWSAHSGLATYEGCDHPAHIASMSTPPTAPIATEPKSCADSKVRW